MTHPLMEAILRSPEEQALKDIDHMDLSVARFVLRELLVSGAVAIDAFNAAGRMGAAREWDKWRAENCEESS